jgi:hypothetical protein
VLKERKREEKHSRSQEQVYNLKSKKQFKITKRTKYNKMANLNNSLCFSDGRNQKQFFQKRQQTIQKDMKRTK